jgi:hypothetical protein
MLASCCLLILAMYIDIFGFSVTLPAVACDMRLTTAQQGMLSAIPLIGKHQPPSTTISIKPVCQRVKVEDSL